MNLIYKNKVIIGTWPLSGDYGSVSLTQIERCLIKSLEMDFCEFDTAPNYGNGFAEFCLGKVFKGRSGIKINTKFGNIPFEGKAFDLKKLRQSVENSLKRLNCERIHVLYLHNPRKDIDNYDDVFQLYEELITEGKIEKKGISLAKGFCYEKYVKLEEFHMVQDDANLLCRESLEKYSERNFTFVARSPLASGLLSGNVTTGKKYSKDDHRSDWLVDNRLESLVKQVNEIAKISPMTVSSLARKYLLENNNIAKVIFGIKREEHLDDIIQDLSSHGISLKFMEDFDQLYSNNFNLKTGEYIAY